MNTFPHEQVVEHTSETRAVFGFWVYVMSDCVLFASLFAVFAVLRMSTFGGPSGSDIFDLPFVLKETLILLTSSFTCGLGVLAARSGDRRATIFSFVWTFILGAAFVALELSEFAQLLARGEGPQVSAFLSSYFTLVGTHGLHVTLGLIWMLILIVRVVQSGLTRSTTRKLMLLGIFWHFLDIIWIFIFSIVYLIGVV